MRVCIVYDHLNKIGGAEKILIAFHELYPDADWYTSFWDPGRANFSAKWQVHHFPFFHNYHEWFPWLMPFIFESYNFSKYDLVISIGSAESKGIITGPNTFHLNYCLTPTRYLYSHESSYLNNPLYKKIGSILKKWDLVASTRPDEMIAISEHVKKRIHKYYNRNSEVIYPPVSAPILTSSAKFSQNLPKALHNDGYFLVVSRLVPYKNLELLIKAANTSKKNLIIIGEGSDRRRLEGFAGPSVYFLGFVNDVDLPIYYHNCLAYLQGNIEDFGISMCEALQSGKPVIAFNGGGATEIVQPGKNGILVETLTASAFAKALIEFDTMSFVSADCASSAARFAKDKWIKLFKERIDSLCHHFQR